MNDGLIIFLHGVGSSGAAFDPLITHWRRTMPGLSFAAPDAPFPFDMDPAAAGSGARQWFSIRDVTEGNRAERTRAARAALDDVLKDCLEREGFTGREDRVVLAGFSQGAIMALDVVMSGRWSFAGVVAFSGRLVPAEGGTPATGTPVLLLHGDADPVMPVQEAPRARTALEAACVPVRLAVLPGLGHSLSTEGAEIAGTFIRSLLVSAPG
ncbi:dienelactone hydrolase family protein [Acetobacter sp. AN02]|uniref:alpha/beta hydrolase n=1 Tax=Acetobacter sp. AN02 TaxID=2894186 RepID=UPI002434183F|nr:dienelactone hydrolase family protein [Acetobacter sp. AN02]MDG6094946.1 dienelactone hydrolase family protein [Acetobacter sp. AN02]